MVYFVILLLLTPMIIYFVKYYGPSRIKLDNGCDELTEDATIVGVRSEPDNWGKYKHIKTIVKFSDGSEYHTYKCRNEPGFGYTRIVVDYEVIDEIKENAIIAHKKKYEKTK